MMLIDRMRDLKRAILRIGEIMKALKGSIKNAAALRMLTTVKPILYNATRWSGKLFVLQRFLKLRNAFIQLAFGEEGPRLNPIFDTILSNIFKNKVEKWVKILEDINGITVMLQTTGMPVNESQELLNVLSTEITTAANQPDARLHGYKLGQTYIGPQSDKLVSPDFHSGIIKIQNKRTNEMNEAEKIACASL